MKDRKRARKREKAKSKEERAQTEDGDTLMDIRSVRVLVEPGVVLPVAVVLSRGSEEGSRKLLVALGCLVSARMVP